MDVIYDALTDYLQAMILTDGFDVRTFTEFDRLFCLMVFFQMSFYREPTTFKCPHCGVEIAYRYDMSKYLQKLETAYIDDQTETVEYKNNTYEFVLGWPDCQTVSGLYHYFHGGEAGEVNEEMERTQFGINYVMTFVKRIRVWNYQSAAENQLVAEIDLTSIKDYGERQECLNTIPSIVMFDDTNGIFPKITGYFINRLENCFSQEICPQCHKETDFGIPYSQVFYSMFYGSLKSLFGFILQVECLCLFRYDCFIFDKEQYLTYNDFANLVKQLSTTVEKDNKERQKIGHDHLYKGLWYIREYTYEEVRSHSCS